MAEVDTLVIATEFDERGLDASVQSALSRINRFTVGVEQAARSLPEISLSTTPAEQSLLALGAAFDRFIGEARDLEAFPDFTTDQAQKEIGELIAAFPGLQQALQGIDPSGVLGVLAQQARLAATEIQQTVSAQQTAAQGADRASSALITESAAFRQARESATTLTAALAATGEATRALAQQGTQPVALNVQPAVNAANTLISSLGLAQRSVTSLRSVLSAPLPPVPPDPNLPILARGYEGFAHRAAEARLEAEALKRTMLGLNGATRGGATGAEKWADGIGNLRAQTAGLTTGFTLSTQQATKLRSGLTGLALSATGAAGPVGQLAQSVLLFGGTGAVAGVALGVAALAALYRLLGTAAREAREEQDRLVQGLLAEANSAVPKAVQAHQALAAALAAEARAREALSRIQLVGRAATAAAGAAGAITNLPSGQIAAQVQQELARRQIKAIADVQRAQRQAADANKAAVLEFQALNVRTLTEAITLNRANAFQIDQARGFERVLTQQAADTTLTIRERLDAYQQLIGLQKALTDESQRTLEFWKQFRAAENQILDAQIQLVRLGFGDPSILTKALTEAAAQARDVTAKEEDRIAAANRLNAAAQALIAPLQRQVEATGASADNILRAFRASQGLSGLGQVLTLTADSSAITDEIEKAEERLNQLRRRGSLVSIDGDATPIIREIETVEARLAQLRSQRGIISLTGADAGPLAQQIRDIDASLARLRASGAQATDAFRALAQQRIGLVEKAREARDLVSELAKVGQAPLELKFETKLTLADPKKAMEEILAELKKRSDEKQFAITLKGLRAPVEIDTSLIGDAERVLENLNVDLKRQNPIWKENNAQADKMLDKLDDARTKAQRFNDSLQDAFDIMNAFGDFGTQTGILSEQDIKAFQVFQDAANSVKSFATGDIVGGIVGALGALGGIFGGGESEHDRIVRENTEAIRRNTAARSEEFTGLGGLADLARNIGQTIAANPTAVRLASSDIGAVRETGSALLEQQFADLGISLEELQRIAEMHGLDVLDEKGRLVGGALDLLQKEIEADIAAQLRFRETLDSITRAGDLRARITGEGIDAESAFQREIDAAAKLGGTAIQQALSGLDLGDTDAVRKAFLGLVDAWEFGTLTAKDLGKLSFEDFKRLLESGAGFLDTFNEGLDNAVNELNIVPKGFRQAALAFEAQIPNLTAPPVSPVLKAVDIPLVNIVGGDGAALPQIAASLGSTGNVLAQIAASLAGTGATSAQQENNAVLARLADLLAKAKIGQSFGDIILQIPSTGQDAYEQAVDIRRALEDISMADYGRTDRWGQT